MDKNRRRFITIMIVSPGVLSLLLAVMHLEFMTAIVFFTSPFMAAAAAEKTIPAQQNNRWRRSIKVLLLTGAYFAASVAIQGVGCGIVLSR
jgi:hypothetical protein